MTLPNINFPPGLAIDAEADFGISPSLADAGPAISAMLADVSAQTRDGRRIVRIGPGTFSIATTVVHPANVVVIGAGPGATVFRQVGGVTVWDFANGYLRSELGYVSIQGQADSDPNTYSLRTGIGVDLAQSQQVQLHDMQIWDFLMGLRMSDGVPFSAYHDIGPHVEVNRCTTGISCPDECNVSSIRQSRVFFSYGDADEGIALDVDDVGGLHVDTVALEACDTCLRVRSTSGLMQMRMTDSYLEPGTNPTTSTVGTLYDVDVDNQSDGIEVLRLEGNVESGNRGDIKLPPEAFVSTDGYSRAFFGARFNGAAAAKRNMIRNGALLYYNLPDTLPNWASGGVAATLAQNTVDFVTGIRSLSATAPSNTLATVSAGFVVSDPGVKWVTCGIRYQVLADNVGFQFAGSVGGNARQYTDPVPDPGTWKEAWVQVPVDPANRTGSIVVSPDTVDGTGAVLIDEVWAVPGRYAVPSSQYAERIEMLQAPIPIFSVSAITGNQSWGTIDITDLPAVLSTPLDDFSTAPEGVVGCILRLTMDVPGAADTTVLSGPFYTTVDVPGAGATTIANSTQRVTAVFGKTPNTATVIVRDVVIGGNIILGTGIATDVEVALVGWILQ